MYIFNSFIFVLFSIGVSRMLKSHDVPSLFILHELLHQRRVPNICRWINYREGKLTWLVINRGEHCTTQSVACFQRIIFTSVRCNTFRRATAPMSFFHSSLAFLCPVGVFVRRQLNETLETSETITE